MYRIRQILQKWGYYDTDGVAYGLYVVGDYAYVADNTDGLRIIDVSDPASAKEVGYYDTGGYARGVYVVGDYAYVADGSYLRIIDVSDPANPQEVGSYDTDGWAVGVYVVDDYAYVADGYLRIIDVSDKANPTEVGHYGTDGWARGVYVVGDYAYVADGYYDDSTHTYKGHLRIIDVSDPTDPTEVGYYDTDGCERGVYVVGDYAYVADGDDGMYIIYYDIIDLVLETFNYGLYYVEGVDTIKWEADTSIHTIEIFHSTDNGNTWQVIDTVLNTGNYVWRIPDILSDSCRLKLQSLEYSDVYDISDNVFRIANFMLINPINGDTLEIGNNYTIEWRSYISNAYMSIFYSMDGGSSWDIISDSTDNDGEYKWYVDTDTLSGCLIKLILKNDTTTYGDTTVSVNIVDRIEITTPNGGEELAPNTTYRIEWRCDSTLEYVDLYYSTDAGNTWNFIKGGIFAPLYYYDWTVPDINTSNALIKIEKYGDSTVYDMSDDVFTIGEAGIWDLANISQITIPTLSTNGIAIKYELSNITPIKVKIYDTAGRLIKNEELQLGRGKNICNIPINSKGIYFVKIYDSNGKLIGQSKVSVVK